MVFEIHTSSTSLLAEPLSFRNDYLGITQEIYRYEEDGKKTHVDARLKQDLTSFGRTWFQNLKDQGFLSQTAKRERLI